MSTTAPLSALFAAIMLLSCGAQVVPMDPLDRSQLVLQPDGSYRYRRPSWCAPCAPCDCACADPIGSAPRTEHVRLGGGTRPSNFGPEVRVTMTTPFWLGRYELTNRCVDLCRLAGSCEALSERLSDEDRATQDSRTLPDHPAGAMSRESAQRACAFFGGSLPTSAQWEFAARGTDARLFPWGNMIECGRGPYGDIRGTSGFDQVFCSPASQPVPRVPVGSYPSGAGPYGTLDMVGGVSEWVSDFGVGAAWFTAMAAQNARGEEPLDPVVPSPTSDTPEGFLRGCPRGLYLSAVPTYFQFGSNTGEIPWVAEGARCRWQSAP